jgi:hypothetical protein
MKITQAGLFLEIDGKLHVVALNHVNLELMVDAIADLSPGGKLSVFPVNDSFKMSSLTLEDLF